MGNGNACTVVEASVAEADEFGKEIERVAICASAGGRVNALELLSADESFEIGTC